MIILCDTIALCIVLTMAIGNRTYITAQLPSVLISEKKFEKTFGPFWIYLAAISFHMIAAGLLCIIGVSRRYLKYLNDKKEFESIRWKPSVYSNSVVSMVS
uniref:Serpentine receptor class gamma n=1 Tax=Syphacia muris TaxID=451379 RepID=A0A0N5AS53_9BILA